VGAPFTENIITRACREANRAEGCGEARCVCNAANDQVKYDTDPDLLSSVRQQTCHRSHGSSRKSSGDGTIKSERFPETGFLRPEVEKMVLPPGYAWDHRLQRLSKKQTAEV
jgi:hypothetical protein